MHGCRSAAFHTSQSVLNNGNNHNNNRILNAKVGSSIFFSADEELHLGLTLDHTKSRCLHCTHGWGTKTWCCNPYSFHSSTWKWRKKIKWREWRELYARNIWKPYKLWVKLNKMKWSRLFSQLKQRSDDRVPLKLCFKWQLMVLICIYYSSPTQLVDLLRSLQTNSMKYEIASAAVYK